MIPKTTFLQTSDDNSDFSNLTMFLHASCSQDVTRLSKSVKESMSSPLNVVASKSTSFETVMTFETGSYRRRTRRYASSPSGSAALITNRCARPLVRGQGWLLNRDGAPQSVRRFSDSAPPKKSSTPTAENSSPFSQLVVLALERLRLVLRRKRADLLLLLW